MASSGPRPDLLTLGPLLDALYHRFNYAERLARDPLEVVLSAHEPGDQEILGLLCASLAYGRVELFKPWLWKIKAHMDAAGGPASYVRGLNPSDPPPFWRTFRYRMTSGAEIWRLLVALKAQLAGAGGLEEVFSAGLKGQDEDIEAALTTFVETLYALGPPPTRAFKHLIPSPSGGSACKRLNLWLRWMVRRQPGLDPGPWSRVRRSQLLLPLDTHSHRMAYNLGLTGSLQARWSTATEITRQLRRLDPDDPVKYDFALCHLGMAGGCPRRREPPICGGCSLHGVCRWWGPAPS